MIRVLVVDGQSMVRAGFRMLLAGEPDIAVVAEASNGRQAIDMAARFHPTVVLMDMPSLEHHGTAAPEIKPRPETPPEAQPSPVSA